MKKIRKSKTKFNPETEPKSMIEIYSDALATIAKKGDDSLYEGEEFIHEWEEEGTKIIGLPIGTIISLPDGDEYELTSRSIIMVNENNKNLWDIFEQE